LRIGGFAITCLEGYNIVASSKILCQIKEITKENMVKKQSPFTIHIDEVA